MSLEQENYEINFNNSDLKNDKTNNFCLESSDIENKTTKLGTNSSIEQNNNTINYKEIKQSLNDQSIDNSDEQSQKLTILDQDEKIKKYNNSNKNLNIIKEIININKEQDDFIYQKYNDSEKLNNSNIEKNINIDEKYRNYKNNENVNINTQSSINEKIDSFNEQKDNFILKSSPSDLKKSEENENQSNCDKNLSDNNKINLNENEKSQSCDNDEFNSHENLEKKSNENNQCESIIIFHKLRKSKKEYLFKKMFTITTEILKEKLNIKKKVKLISKYNYNDYKNYLETKIEDFFFSENEKNEKKINLQENEDILNMELKDFIINDETINKKYKKFFKNKFLIYYENAKSFDYLYSIKELIKEIENNKGNKKNKKKFFKVENYKNK